MFDSNAFDVTGNAEAVNVDGLYRKAQVRSVEQVLQVKLMGHNRSIQPVLIPTALRPFTLILIPARDEVREHI